MGGCASAQSNAIAITTTTPAGPAITTPGSTAFCSPGSITLSAPAVGSSTPATDLSYGGIENVFPGTQFWQAFTPTAPGFTTGIRVMIYEGSSPVTYNFTLKIYSGSGVSGALLYTQSSSITNTANLIDFITIPIPAAAGISLTPGSTFTFQLVGTNAMTFILNQEATGDFYVDNYGLNPNGYHMTYQTVVTPDVPASYQWYTGSSPVSGATAASYAAIATGSYTCKTTRLNGCVSAASNAVAVTANAPGTWVGISSNWNNSTNWCGGTPTASTDVLIPATGSVPFDPHVLAGAVANAHNISITNGTVSADAGGTMNLYGNIQLTPAGASSAGAGNVNLAGCGIQEILPAFAVNDMTISGGSAKMLNSNVTVNHSLTFTSGMLDVGSNTLILAPGATITGAGPASYVRTSATGGRLQQQVGSSNVLFPVGNATYNPATLSNSGTTDNYLVGDRDEVLTGGTTGSPAIGQIVNCTWDVEEQTAGGSNVTMTLQWNAAQQMNGFDNNHVFISHYTGGQWVNTCCSLPIQALAATSQGSNVYTTTQGGITSFSPFSVSSAGATPLPVTLIDIAATNVGDRNKIEWQSAVEETLATYELQRSADGISFDKMATLNAEGHAYDYIAYDNAPVAGSTYYRLKMISTDGSATLSKTVQATMQHNSSIHVQVHPNPMGDELQVDVQGATEGTVVMTDATGKTISSTVISNEHVAIDTHTLAAGVYFINYSNGGMVKTLKVTKR